MRQGEVVGLYIAAEEGAPTAAQAQVEAIAGKGLAGDRNFGTTKPDQEVTLFEIETIEALEREQGATLTPAECRRNIITRGVALNHLIGREFRVGAAVLRGMRLCEPCLHLESLTRPGVLAALVHRGGLRAAIVSGGIIRVGDAVEE